MHKSYLIILELFVVESSIAQLPHVSLTFVPKFPKSHELYVEEDSDVYRTLLSQVISGKPTLSQ